ncbi:MAG TPA: phosphonate ABC transporter ATP-binding protein, partial [Dehalococcoidia bacterium]|nr:phosphonate ABC transporter ATP-binding protein [Dehalococcoidia bacterium]
LEIKDLRLVYPNGYEALKSINLTVDRGEIVAVVGRSGAGKSTLLRCINGLERPTEGSVVLDGQDVARLSGKELRALQQRIGFIWQEYNLVERLSVITNVLCGRLACCEGARSLLFYFNREQREVAVRSLERVNMLHRAKQRADRLSGGEKQRVAIARAVAQQPTLILADEPVASLDPELSIQVMDDLARVARDEGVPTLINIHAVELARMFCDRVVGIANGVVVFDGPVSALDEAAMDSIYRFDRASAHTPAVESIREPELVPAGV